MEEFSNIFSKRGEGIVDSAIEKVRGRIELLAKTEGLSIAELDGTPEGVLQFFLINREFKIISKEDHEAFLYRLLIIDTVLKGANSRFVEQSGAEGYIEIEPRKDW